MARLVKRTRGGPYQVTVGNETKFICGCGLSAAQPFCDGTHKKTRDEQPDVLCWYDASVGRHEATQEFPDIRTPAE